METDSYRYDERRKWIILTDWKLTLKAYWQFGIDTGIKVVCPGSGRSVAHFCMADLWEPAGGAERGKGAPESARGAGGSVIVRRLIYARNAITLLLGRIPTAVLVPLARMHCLFAACVACTDSCTRWVCYYLLRVVRFVTIVLLEICL